MMGADALYVSNRKPLIKDRFTPAPALRFSIKALGSHSMVSTSAHSAENSTYRTVMRIFVLSFLQLVLCLVRLKV